MVIESFPSYHNIGLTLNRQNCYGIKPLQVNRYLGFNKPGLITLTEALSVVSLKAIAWIDSLSEVTLPELLIEESKQQQAVKVLNMQWTSSRKQMDLYLLQNQNAYLLGSLAILHPSGYPYTQYNLMEMLDTVNDRFLISNDFDLGVEIKDAGYGYLNGDDKITVFGSVERIVTAYAPQTVTTTSINYGDDEMIAQDFLTAMFQIAEGTVKPGYTGGVTYNYNQNNETIFGSFTIPVFATVDSVSGKINYLAKDAFDPPSSGGGSTPQNTAPTNITLSNASIDENLAGGSTVGVFTASGGYGSNTFTYGLVSGTGDSDNAAFTITGNALTINASPDYETKSSYSIRVQVTDSNNLSYQKAFTVTVNDISENTVSYNLNLFVSNGQITNSGTTFATVTNNGCTVDASGIVFNNSSLLISSPGGYDLNGDFEFEFDIVSNGVTSGLRAIADFRQFDTTAPMIQIGATVLRLYIAGVSRISFTLPQSTNLTCKYQRINKVNKLIVNDVESTSFTEVDTYSGWAVNDIWIGKLNNGTIPFIGTLDNIRFSQL